jgi:hypothetical protein
MAGPAIWAAPSRTCGAAVTMAVRLRNASAGGTAHACCTLATVPAVAAEAHEVRMEVGGGPSEGSRGCSGVCSTIGSGAKVTCGVSVAHASTKTHIHTRKHMCACVHTDAHTHTHTHTHTHAHTHTHTHTQTPLFVSAGVLRMMMSRPGRAGQKRPRASLPPLVHCVVSGLVALVRHSEPRLRK